MKDKLIKLESHLSVKASHIKGFCIHKDSRKFNYPYQFYYINHESIKQFICSYDKQKEAYKMKERAEKELNEFLADD